MKRTSAFIQTINAIGMVAFCAFSSTAFACTTDGWNGTLTGSPVADSPANVARVSGLCGMELADEGSVMDTSPVNESTFIARFYVKGPVSSGTPVIFEAFSDDAATASLITVTFDGTNFVFNAGSGDSPDVPGNPTGWNLVEISWASSTGMSYWVNADAAAEPTPDDPTGSVGASGGTVESVVLGARGTFGGTLTFDDYVSHRSTPIGGLLAGDANNDGSINSGDIDMVVNEFLFSNLADGVVDCNLDGAVNSGDIDCIIGIFLFGN